MDVTLKTTSFGGYDKKAVEKLYRRIDSRTRERGCRFNGKTY